MKAPGDINTRNDWVCLACGCTIPWYEEAHCEDKDEIWARMLAPVKERVQ